MRPDSVDPLPDRIKTEPIARVNPARGKEREERDREAGEPERKNSRRRRDGVEDQTTEPDRTREKSPASEGGENPRRGTRIDLVI